MTLPSGGPAKLPTVSADAQLIRALEQSTEFPVTFVDHESASEPVRFSLSDVVSEAKATHPRAFAAHHLIEKAHAEIGVAELRENLDLVLDVDTPIQNDDDATQLQARVTFPIGPNNRGHRIRIARRNLVTAEQQHHVVLRQLGNDALEAGLRVAYLQQKLLLDEKLAVNTRELVALLAPENRLGDATENSIDHLDAVDRARSAADDLFQTRRELGQSRVTLASAIGWDLADPSNRTESILVDHDFESGSLDLPPRERVIAAALEDSAEIDAALSAATATWAKYHAERERTPRIEIGPRYQDRLGEEDDTVGVRWRSELPRVGNALIRSRPIESEARWMNEQIQVVRNEVAARTASDYHELQLVAEQLATHRSDTFVQRQQAMLGDPAATAAMTGDQILQIEEAVLRHQRARLELEYRFARLRSKIRIHTIVQEVY